MYTEDKFEVQNWMCVIFRPADGKPRHDFLTGHHCMDSGLHTHTHINTQSVHYNPQMQVKPVSIEETTCERDPETPLSSLG